MTEEVFTPAVTAALYAIGGAGYALYSLALNVEKNGKEKLDPLHMGSTVVLFAVAGAAMSILGDEFSSENLVYVGTSVAILADKYLNLKVDTRLYDSEGAQGGSEGATPRGNDPKSGAQHVESSLDFDEDSDDMLDDVLGDEPDESDEAEVEEKDLLHKKLNTEP